MNRITNAENIGSSPAFANEMLAEGLDSRKELLRNRRNAGMSYRECFGLENPPVGTELEIDFIEGLGYYVMYPNCPDSENIIEGWFKTKQQAIDFININGWLC